jgi:hypothetical protein
MKSFTIFVLAIFLISCAETKTGQVEDQYFSNKNSAQPHLLSEEIWQLMNDSIGSVLNYEVLQEKLFGKFFGDRVEFFIIKDLQKSVHGSSVKSLTLTYLDGKLGKAKYILEDDITESMINMNGKFSIIGFDPTNRELILTQLVVNMKDKKYTLHEELNNYQLTWKTEGIEVILRINKNDSLNGIQYIEKLENYDRIYRSIEKGTAKASIL